MKKRLLQVVAMGVPLIAFGTPADAQGPTTGIICDKVAIGSLASTSVIVVTGVAGVRVNVCGWMATIAGSTASGTISFSYTSVANACSATTTALTSVMNVNGGGPVIKDTPTAVLSTPLGVSFCANPSATAVNYMVFYGIS